jgi:hypothetical protein
MGAKGFYFGRAQGKFIHWRKAEVLELKIRTVEKKNCLTAV